VYKIKQAERETEEKPFASQNPLEKKTKNQIAVWKKKTRYGS